MQRKLACMCFLLVVLAFARMTVRAQTAPPAAAQPQTPDPETALRQHVEGYLRYLFAWGPDVQVSLGPLRQSALPGLLTTLVQVNEGQRQSQEVFLVSDNGRFIIRGDFLDTTEDPFAQARDTIATAAHPSKGAADAPVTIVEYGDFQCPTCAEAYPILKKLIAERKDVRLVFKDLPLTRIHDWALPAAIAGQCAYQQSNESFWRLHDYFFENQKQLNAQNLEARLDAFALRAGLDAQKFRACRAQALTQSTVQLSMREAATLDAANTPTLFINGRRLIGAQAREALDRIIAFELLVLQQEQGTNPR